MEEIASVPSSASIARPRSRVETQLGRCLWGTFQIRLNALWEAFMIPSPASSANASPIASAGALPVREWNLIWSLMIGNCPSTPLRIFSRSCGLSSRTNPRIVTNTSINGNSETNP